MAVKKEDRINADTFFWLFTTSLFMHIRFLTTISSVTLFYVRERAADQLRFFNKIYDN